MNTTVYRSLQNTDVVWICVKCDIPNYSSVFSNPPLIESSDNRFSLLSTLAINSSLSELNFDNITQQSTPAPTKSSPGTLSPIRRSRKYSPDNSFSLPSPRSKNSSLSEFNLENRTHQSSPASTKPNPVILSSPLAASSPKPLNYSVRSNSDSQSSYPSSIESTPPTRKNRKDNLKVVVMNCQSILNKIPELHTFTDTCQPDIIVGTESWLTPSVMSSEVFPDDYITYRKDRQDKKGGGVFICVKKDLISSEISLNITSELLFVKIHLKDQKDLIVGSFYRPDWTDEEYFQNLTDCLQQLRKPDQVMWLGGDFNLGDIDWDSCSVKPPCSRLRLSQSLLQAAEDFSLTQVVKIPTRKERILDLFLTSHPNLVNRVQTIPPLTSAMDHDIVFVDVNTRADIQKKSPQRMFRYNKADWEAMRTAALNLDLDGEDVQMMWDSFEQAVHGLMEKHIPQGNARPSTQKPWVTEEVKGALKKRNRAYRRWRKTKSDEHRAQFVRLKAAAQQTLRAAHRQYTEGMLNLESDNSDQYESGNHDNRAASKKFWSYIKSKRKDPCGVSPLKSEGTLISDAKGKASVLNTQYCSVFTKENTPAPRLDTSSHPPMPEIIINLKGVEKALHNLKPNKASGPDRISPRVLKELAVELSPHLTRIFQKSLETGTVPKQWKTALVTPVFKKGDRNQASNYRPVSLTAVCCKVCEHIVSKAIMEHLETNNLLTDCQHGFRASRSCETQLLSFSDEMLRGIAAGKQFDIAILDFSKAFDVVPHHRLVMKLDYYGIRGPTLAWIRAFLSDRTQRVVVDGETSDSAPVTSGVPQGSVLGPILFLAFINDMPEMIRSKCRLFADDSILYREIRSPEDTTILQHDLDELHKWEVKWGMSFNPSKCHVMHMTRKKKPILKDYTLKGETLETVESATYLGIELSSDLSWNKHITKTCNKANRTLGFVKRNIITDSTKAKQTAYKTLVRPQTEYAASVWDPHTDRHQHNIEMVQRRAARWACSQYDRQASVTEMLQRLEWETLEVRRAKIRVLMLYKVVHHMVAISNSQLTPRTTVARQSHPYTFLQLHAKQSYYHYSFFPWTIPLWNLLPCSIMETSSLDSFKAQLAQLQLPSLQY